MAKSSRNSVLAFVWAVLALLALYVLPASLDARASVCDCSSYESVYLQTGEAFVAPSRNFEQSQPSDSYLDDPFGSSTKAAFWGSRRPSAQMTLRPQRGGLLYRLLGRDGSFFRASQVRAFNGFTYFCPNTCFPTPLSYHVPKEYYVFTLKRILC